MPEIAGDIVYSSSSYRIKIYVPAESFKQYKLNAYLAKHCIVSSDWNQSNSYTSVETGPCENGQLGYIVVSDQLPNVRTFSDVNKLKISSGTIDTDDWYALRQMPNLISLDLSGLSILEIPAGALKGCWQLEELILPAKVRTIAREAFQTTGIRALVLPETLREVTGGWNFNDCDSLTSISFPDSVLSLPQSAFSNCDNLQQVKLPACLQTMESGCFANCALTEVELPAPLQEVGYRAFYYNAILKKVTFAAKSSTHTIQGEAFKGCTQLGVNEALQLPSSMKKIDYEAFSGCTAMKGVELNEGLESIGREAFCNCRSLTNLTLPSSMIYCVQSPFTGCDNIAWIECRSLIPPTIKNYIVTGKAGERELRVPLWSFQEYMTTPGWLEFQDHLTIIENNLPENIVINKDFEFVLTETQNPAGYTPNIKMLYNEDRIDDGFGHTKVERGNLTISSRSKLNVNHFSMHLSPYAKYEADRSRYYNNYNYNYDYYSTKYNPNSLIVNGEMRAEDQTIHLMLRNDKWQFVSFPFDVAMTDIVPNDALTQWVVRRYDGAARATQEFDNTWKNLASTDVLQAGKGYIMKCYLQNPSDGLVTFTVRPVVNSLSRQYLFTSEDRTTALEEHNGNDVLQQNRSWNLVGNPYPCYFDSRYMDTEAPFMIWDSYNDKYVAYSPIDDNYVLNPGEAFFMQRPISDGEQLTFLKGGRQTYRNPNDLVVKRAKAFVPQVGAKRMVLNIVLSNNEQSDRTRVVFNPEAQMSYEVGKDATHFMAMNEVASQIWTTAQGVDYAINERPVEDGIVALSLYCGVTADYTISLGENSGAESFVLLDKATGKQATVTMEQPYTFTTTQGMVENRFFITDARATGIESVVNQTSQNNSEAYNLKGERVPSSQKGIVIQNGVKILNQ